MIFNQTNGSSGGVQTALVYVAAGTRLFYTDENMTAQTGNAIYNQYLPIGTIIAVWDEGPPPAGSPFGVVQIAQYGNVARGGRLTVYEVTG